MQPLTASPRDALTSSAVSSLLVADSITVGAGLELVDASGVVLQDISDRLVSGTIHRDNYATIHGTCDLVIESALPWGSVRVRPFMTIADGNLTARFNLGVFVLSTPDRAIGVTPETYSVTGYDKLQILDSPAGATFSVDNATPVVTAIQGILTSLGETDFAIDPSSAVLPSARVYPLDDQTTWLHIVNDLLSAIGYIGLWVDWNGTFRSGVYTSPAQRAPEWTYDAGDPLTIVGATRTASADYFSAPNRWVFVQSDPAGGVSNPDLAGVYEVVNQSDGPTSVDARGRTITKVVTLSVTDTDALVASGNQTVDADKTVSAVFQFSTGPNPLHWHMDVIRYVDAAFGPTQTLISQSWDLPLDGSQMSHKMKAV